MHWNDAETYLQYNNADSNKRILIHSNDAAYDDSDSDSGCSDYEFNDVDTDGTTESV